MKIIAITLAASIFTNCTRASQDSSDKSVQGPQPFGNMTKDPNKAQVLIFYANEPAPTAKYNSEKASLIRSFDGAISLRPLLAKQIGRSKAKFDADFDKFNSAVKDEMKDLQEILCNAGSTSKSGVIFFTNSSIVSGKIAYCLPSSELTYLTETQVAALTRLYAEIKDTNKLYDHSPLSHNRMFQAALSIVSQVFRSTEFEYSLDLKSHGSVDKFLTPRIGYESTMITPEVVASVYESSKPVANTNPIGPSGFDKDGFDKEGFDKDGLDKQGLDKQGLDKQGLDKQGLDKQGLDKQGLSKDGLAELPAKLPPENAVGASKRDILETLTVTSKPMYFNVVFFESCKSDLGLLVQDLADDLAPNVGYFFTSDFSGLEYRTLNWRNLATQNSLRDWLKSDLERIAKSK